MKAYPLEEKWLSIRNRIESAGRPGTLGINRNFYLDVAEHIVRSAVPWQNESGIVIDPYYHEEANSCTARFVGALGQLIKAGRCVDLIEPCVKGYEACLARLNELEQYPEFWTKELMYAHDALLSANISADISGQWQQIWDNHEPRKCYGCIVENLTHNYLVFALAGEFFKTLNGFNGDCEFIQQAIETLSQDFTEFGMYRDPGDPMTYDLVTKQQLDLIRHYGYDGLSAGLIQELTRRGAITSLLCQSVTGQMPFGGRSNQFHFVEAHFACLCESQAQSYKQKGDLVTAGVLKRAARNAVVMSKPWIMEMDPFRHTKQGFHPQLQHGIDSGGYYSVYGLLHASLLGTAYHIADESIEEYLTPAEIGGFVFDLQPAFHKVFATCQGYHVEIDSHADHQKEATGLGRFQRVGIMPESALSASFASHPLFNEVGVLQDQSNLAIGPVWEDDDLETWRLADFDEQIEEAVVEVSQQTDEKVIFRVVYSGNLGGQKQIAETYSLSIDGLVYDVSFEHPPNNLRLTIPLIQTDGLIESKIFVNDNGFEVRYRDAVYSVLGPTACLIENETVVNRNAIYRIGMIKGSSLSLRLGRKN